MSRFRKIGGLLPFPKKRPTWTSPRWTTFCRVMPSCRLFRRPWRRRKRKMTAWNRRSIMLNWKKSTLIPRRLVRRNCWTGWVFRKRNTAFPSNPFPAAGVCVWILRKPWFAAPICSCLTNRPTTWIWKLSCGWKTILLLYPARKSSFPTTVIFSMRPPPKPLNCRSKNSRNTAAITIFTKPNAHNVWRSNKLPMSNSRRKSNICNRLSTASKPKPPKPFKRKAAWRLWQS